MYFSRQVLDKRLELLSLANCSCNNEKKYILHNSTLIDCQFLCEGV